MTSTYKPNGRSHYVLAEISRQPIGRRDLQAVELNERARKKIPFVLEALTADGLIYRSFGEYRLTDAGAVLLEGLDRQADDDARRAA